MIEVFVCGALSGHLMIEFGVSGHRSHGFGARSMAGGGVFMVV